MTMTIDQNNANRTQVGHYLVFQPGRHKAWRMDHQRATLERFLREQDRCDLATAAVDTAGGQVPVPKDPRGAYCIGCGAINWFEDNPVFLLSFTATTPEVGIHTLCGTCSKPHAHDDQSLELFLAQIVETKGHEKSPGNDNAR
jgi:hypothetical protein